MDYPTAPPVAAAPDPPRRWVAALAARTGRHRGLALADPRPLWRRRPGWLRGSDADRLTALDMSGYAAGLAMFAGVLLASVAVFAMAGLTTLDLIIGLPVCVGAVACGVAAISRSRDPAGSGPLLPVLMLSVVGIVLPFVWATVWIHVVGW